MDKKRKTLKIRCDCGGVFKKGVQEIDGLTVAALVCSKCDFVTLTMDQAKRLMKLRQMMDSIGKRKVVRIGNTCGVTFPPILVHPAQEVEVRPLSPNKYILTFGK